MLGLFFASTRGDQYTPGEAVSERIIKLKHTLRGIPHILVPYGIDYAMLLMMGIQSLSVRVMVLMIPHQMPGQKPLKKTEETHSV